MTCIMWLLVKFPNNPANVQDDKKGLDVNMTYAIGKAIKVA
jgi:hypothetical protein